MRQKFERANKLDGNGKPAGGYVHTTGLTIQWQDGPLGRGDDRKEPNGTFIETVIAAALQRIEWYQEGEFSCEENETAGQHLHAALQTLERRTAKRKARGVEGTHTP